jgi:hypothetical protein
LSCILLLFAFNTNAQFDAYDEIQGLDSDQITAEIFDTGFIQGNVQSILATIYIDGFNPSGNCGSWYTCDLYIDNQLVEMDLCSSELELVSFWPFSSVAIMSYDYDSYQDWVVLSIGLNVTTCNFQIDQSVTEFCVEQGMVLPAIYTSDPLSFQYFDEFGNALGQPSSAVPIYEGVNIFFLEAYSSFGLCQSETLNSIGNVCQTFSGNVDWQTTCTYTLQGIESFITGNLNLNQFSGITSAEIQVSNSDFPSEILFSEVLSNNAISFNTINIDTPGIYFVDVIGLDNLGNQYFIDSISFEVIPSPAWMYDNSNFAITSSTESLVDSNPNDCINEIRVTLNLPNSILTLPNDIIGIKNSEFSVETVNYQFDVEFNQGSGQFENPSNGTFQASFNVLNQSALNYNEPTIYLPEILSNNELFFDWTETFDLGEQNLKFPLGRVPLVFCPIPLKVDCGIKTNLKLKSKLNFSSSEAGIQVDTVSIGGSAQIQGFLRATSDVLIAKASASLILTGKVGAGMFLTPDYSEMQSINGVTLDVDGDVSWGWAWNQNTISRNFYHYSSNPDFDNSPYFSPLFHDTDLNYNTLRVFDQNTVLQAPTTLPQPDLSGRDSLIYAVWLDNDNNNGTTSLLLTYKNSNSGNFLWNPIVVDNSESLSNPKVAILNNGNALIAWTKASYNESIQLADTTDLFKCQDIYVSYFDKQSNTVSSPVQISDDNSSWNSGRAEGMPNIYMGPGSSGIITWNALNESNSSNSDIYYCAVNQTANSVTLDYPQIIFQDEGEVKSINFAFYSDNNAIASWIYDPDGNEETLNSDIRYSNYTASSNVWSTPTSLVSVDSNTSFDELSMDFNGNYGAMSYTTTTYDETYGIAKSIYALAWNPNATSEPYWAAQSSAHSDSTSFNKPTIACNSNGITALSFQEVKLNNTTSNIDQGNLQYYFNNSAQNPDEWFLQTDIIFGNSQGNSYVWDMNSAFDDNNNFYLITHEIDSITGQAPLNPTYGVPFGNSYMNMIFREFHVSDDLVATDVAESIVPNNLSLNDILNIYPNPATTEVNLELKLRQAGTVEISLFDTSGSLVDQINKGAFGNGTYLFNYQPNNLAPGIYIVRVSANNLSVNKKLIIQ